MAFICVKVIKIVVLYSLLAALFGDNAHTFIDVLLTYYAHNKLFNRLVSKLLLVVTSLYEPLGILLTTREGVADSFSISHNSDETNRHKDLYRIFVLGVHASSGGGQIKMDKNLYYSSITSTLVACLALK